MISIRAFSLEPQSVSERVVAEVAVARGIHPIEITTPLYESVDPDALDALFRSPRTSVSVSFEFAGCSVTVTGNEAGTSTDVEVTTSPDSADVAPAPGESAISE